MLLMIIVYCLSRTRPVLCSSLSSQGVATTERTMLTIDDPALKPAKLSSPLMGNVHLTPIALARSVLNAGDLVSNAIVTVMKAPREKALRISVLGGSITCGVGGSMEPMVGDIDDRPQGPQDAWPHHLSILLEEAFKSLNQDFLSPIVMNMCKPSTGSNGWVDYIAVARSEKTRTRGNAFYFELKMSDIVIVETALNDVYDLELYGNMYASQYTSNDDSIRTHTEILISMILATKPDIQIVYLNPSTRGMVAWKGEWPRNTDAVYQQLDVVKHYGLPYISVIDGLGPFSTPALEHWFLYRFRADDICHVMKSGHQIIAYFVGSFLLNIYRSVNSSPLFTPAMEPSNNVTKPLKWASQTEINMYLLYAPLHIPFLSDEQYQKYKPTKSEGWYVREESRHQSGMIATDPGELLSLTLSKKLIEKHVQAGVVHIILLKSYEHMGQVKVTVGGTGRFDRNVTTIVDCLWPQKVSVPVIVEIKIPWSGNETDLTVSLLVLSSVPERKGNKIKLLGITVF